MRKVPRISSPPCRIISSAEGKVRSVSEEKGTDYTTNLKSVLMAPTTVIHFSIEETFVGSFRPKVKIFGV